MMSVLHLGSELQAASLTGVIPNVSAEQQQFQSRSVVGLLSECRCGYVA